MFQSQSHLPQLLANEHYQSPEVHAREMEQLFVPAWHCVATTADLREPGAYTTLDLLGRPLLIHRGRDRLRAFLNVCTHRFSTLTDQPRGKFEGRIKCQYHGWEYDEEGCTCKIPDARQFRPLKKGQLGLREFRCATLGQLVFVCLDERTPTLEEYLPEEFQALLLRWFTPQHRPTLINSRILQCNWKIVMENILESYHIQCVHPKSFAYFPEPEHCSHRFFPTYDHYIHHFEEEPRYANPERWVSRLTGRKPDYRWHHLLRYPNMILGGAGPFHYLQMIWPLAPDRCVSTWYSFHWSGASRGLWTRSVDFWLARYGRRAAIQVQQEDADIYPSVHRGTVAVERPHGGGLISAREERIFAFQRYWLDQICPQHAPVREDEIRQLCRDTELLASTPHESPTDPKLTTDN